MSDQSHGVFAQHIASAHLCEPVHLVVAHIQGGRDGQNVWILALAEVRDRELRADKSAARIDLLDKIKAFDGHILNTSWVNGTCIVDQDVNTTECFDCEIDCSLYAGSVSNVALNREGTATRIFDLLCGSVDCAGKLWVISDCLSSDCNISTVSGTSLSNFKTDSTGCTADKDSLAFERARLSLGEVERNECFQSPHWHARRAELIVHLGKSVIHFLVIDTYLRFKKLI